MAGPDFDPRISITRDGIAVFTLILIVLDFSTAHFTTLSSVFILHSRCDPSIHAFFHTLLTKHSTVFTSFSCGCCAYFSYRTNTQQYFHRTCFICSSAYMCTERPTFFPLPGFWTPYSNEVSLAQPSHKFRVCSFGIF